MKFHFLDVFRFGFFHLMVLLILMYTFRYLNFLLFQDHLYHLNFLKYYYSNPKSFKNFNYFNKCDFYYCHNFNCFEILLTFRIPLPR